VDKIYIGDVGTKFIISTGVDLTDATSTKAKIKKPGGTTVTWDCDVEGAATGGKISYETIANDLDEAGNYVGNAKVEFGAKKFTGETFGFMVLDEFE
jgi:uncharacterized membrane protein